MLIVLQDYPDPDAIASAAALRELANTLTGVQCSIAHRGVVGRSENQAMVKYLGLNLRPLNELELDRFDVIALVDTQPGTGNNSLPPDAEPDIVIDHHPIRRATRSAEFTDVRSKYGATSTILYEYLHEANIAPEPPLATALLYAIRSDTQDLGTEATKADIEALIALYPIANTRMLSEIQRGRLPRAYFQMLAHALRDARVYGSGIVTGLGEIDNPDMIGEVADLLLRNNESVWALCFGLCEDRILLSLRTSDTTADAGQIMRRIVGRTGTGGGHSALAGGQIPLKNGTEVERRRIEADVRRRFLRVLGANGERCQKLVDLEG